MWRRPPRKIFHGGVAIVGAGVMWAAGNPFGFGLAFSLTFVLMLLAGMWAARGAAFLLFRRRGSAVGDARWFLVAPILGAVAVVAVSLDLPLKARWAASEASFERVAEDVLSDGVPRWDESHRVGLYRVHRIYIVDGSVFFQDPEGAFLTVGGFAFLPDGPSESLNPVGGPIEFRHLRGDWFIWEAYF